MVKTDVQKENKKERKYSKNEKWKIEQHPRWEVYFLILLVLLAVFLLPNTSPFSSESVWCMTNDYFNFAKSMMQGKVLYADLYDHKGLFLFILYMIPVWISDTSLVGVFLMEAIVSTGVVISCYIFCRYRYNVPASLGVTGVTILLLRLVFTQVMLNTEPLCLIMLYCLLHYIDKGTYKEYRIRDYFLFGLLFSILLWMKFPMVIVLFPFWLYLCIDSWKIKEMPRFLARCCISVAVVAGFSFWMVSYFVKNDILDLLVSEYFMGVNSAPITLIGSMLEYSILFLYVLAFTGLILKKDRKFEDIYFLIWILVLFLITNLPGGIRTYTSSFVVIILAMFLPDMVKFLAGRTVATASLATIILLFIPMQIPDENAMDTVELLSKKYSVTNDNVMYITEDMGFGTYSEEPFRHKYQWKPARISYDNNDELYAVTLEWLAGHEFDYVCVYAPDYDYEIDFEKLGVGHRYGIIIKAIQDNYKILDAFAINEGHTDMYYLCTVKGE